jgi:metallo-beta-lactamase class B VIM
LLREPGRRLAALTFAALLLSGTAAFAAGPSKEAKPKAHAPEKSTVLLRLLKPGVWIHTSRYVFPDGSVIPANGLVVREGSSLVLIDTAWGEMLTAELLDEIQREIKLPVRRAIVTHSHADRLAGADLLRQRGIPVYAHPLTMRRAAAVAISMPTDSLTGLRRPGDAVFVGSVEVFYPGPAHSPDNVMVWVPSSRVLFGGCAVKALDWNLGNLADADVRRWPDALHRVMARYPKAEVVVPGHGDVGGTDLIGHTLDLLNPKPASKPKS